VAVLSEGADLLARVAAQALPLPVRF